MDTETQEPAPATTPAGPMCAEEPIRWRAPLTGTDRWVLAAVTLVATLAGVHTAESAWETRARRDALLAKSVAEAGALSRPEAELLDRVRGWAFEAATGDTSDFVGHEGELDALLERPGLYLRAAAPEVTRRGGIADAIRSSTKDGFALCLLDPPASTADADVAVAAMRSPPASPAFADRTRKLAPVEAVQRGLRVLTPGWAEEVKAADALGLRALEVEWKSRTDAEITAARGWSSAAYFVAVIDELPAGMRAPEAGSQLEESMRTSMLPAVQARPHEVRVAVFDLETRRPVLRLRRPLDAPAFAARTGLPDGAAALSQDCALGAAVRRAASPAAQAAR
jgi:hypothetical protein